MEHFVTTSRGKDVSYICLAPPYLLNSPPFDGHEFVVLIINNDPEISTSDQYELSLALVRSGCRYAVCMGHDCSTWDDSIDWACLQEDPDSSDKAFVMTTWHEDETPDAIASFFLNCTTFDDNVFDKFLVLSVGRNDTLLAEIKRECLVA